MSRSINTKTKTNMSEIVLSNNSYKELQTVDSGKMSQVKKGVKEVKETGTLVAKIIVILSMIWVVCGGYKPEMERQIQAEAQNIASVNVEAQTVKVGAFAIPRTEEEARIEAELPEIKQEHVKEVKEVPEVKVKDTAVYDLCITKLTNEGNNYATGSAYRYSQFIPAVCELVQNGEITQRGGAYFLAQSFVESSGCKDTIGRVTTQLNCWGYGVASPSYNYGDLKTTYGVTTLGDVAKAIIRGDNFWNGQTSSTTLMNPKKPYCVGNCTHYRDGTLDYYAKFGF